MGVRNNLYFNRKKMGRLDKGKEIKLQPERLNFAKNKLSKLGIEITFESQTELRFFFKGNEVKFFPYSGWHTGKSINDGRGINNLLKQLKND